MGNAMGMTEIAVAAEDVVQACRPHLAGKGPFVQGFALADMVALWLAGHPERLRGDLLQMHRELVDQLLPVHAEILGTH